MTLFFIRPDEQDGNTQGRLSVSDRRAALRRLIIAMFPDGFRAEALTAVGQQEVRDGLNAALLLYDDMKE